MLILDDDEPARTKASALNRFTVGLLLTVTLSIGTTLATNINLSSESSVEFGQGIVITAACDGAIEVNINESFDNTSANNFRVNELVFTDIANACFNKSFSIATFNETSSTMNGDWGHVIVDFVRPQSGEPYFSVASDQSGFAFISTMTIDTSTTGSGSRGSMEERGRSSFSLKRLFGGDFMRPLSGNVHRVTLMSFETGGALPNAMRSPLAQQCQNTDKNSLSDLDSLMTVLQSQITNSLALLDVLDEDMLSFSRLANPKNPMIARNLDSFAIITIKTVQFQNPLMGSCKNSFSVAAAAEQDQIKRGWYLDLVQTMDDLLLVSDTLISTSTSHSAQFSQAY